MQIYALAATLAAFGGVKKSIAAAVEADFHAAAIVSCRVAGYSVTLALLPPAVTT